MAIASLNYISTFVATVRVLASLGGIKEKFQGHNLNLDDVTKQAINKTAYVLQSKSKASKPIQNS